MRESELKTTAEIILEKGELPRLLYANRQEYGGEKHERPMHSHKSLCEMLICYRGQGIYHVDESTYRIREGDVIFYNVGEQHEVLSDEDTEIGTYCFGYTDVCFKGLPRNYLIPPKTAHVRPAGTKFEFLKELSQQIMDLDSKDPRRTLQFQCMAMTMLLTVCALPAVAVDAALSDRASDLTVKVKEYIGMNYTKPFQLEDMALELSFSAPYISHTFKAATGYSPMEYAIRCRIGLAQTLLISSELSVTHIATEVGYDNTNYFQTLFKRVVGITPLQYRKKYLASLRGNRDQS